jgi:hypothetical protein
LVRANFAHFFILLFEALTQVQQNKKEKKKKEGPLADPFVRQKEFDETKYLYV